jgi:ACS family pantothenate transporter-like MFS transporter
LFVDVMAYVDAVSTPTELATRIAIFGTSYPASSIFVSFMQTALHKTMNGKGGLPGWKWL